MRTSTLSQLELETIAQAIELSLQIFNDPPLGDLGTGAVTELEEAQTILNGHLSHLLDLTEKEITEIMKDEQPIDPEEVYRQQQHEEQLAEDWYGAIDGDQFTDDYREDLGC